jgi:2-methylcitrate dehydratase PrpD
LKETPTLIKPHPSCGGTHAAMNGMLQLIETYDIREEDVEKVDVGMNQGGVDSLYYPDPKDIYEAKFSMHFCIALLLHYRRWGLALHTNEVVNSPEMRALYPKVNFFMDEDLDKSIDRDYTDYHAIVTVTMKDGKTYSIHSNPPQLNFDQIKQKFYECTGEVISTSRSDKIAAIIENLERYNQADLMKLLEL